MKLTLDKFTTVEEKADCGCSLFRNTKGVVTYRGCALHDAAPELLAALEEAMPLIQINARDSGNSSLLRLARAAIEKAKS